MLFHCIGLFYCVGVGIPVLRGGKTLKSPVM